MKVRIVNCTDVADWYSQLIGKEFEVTKVRPDGDFEVKYGASISPYLIDKNDCVVVGNSSMESIFTGQQLIDIAERLQKENLDIMKSKNHDYAGEYAFSNFVDSAELAGITERQSILVGIGTKYSRLKNLLRDNKTPNNESIEDTIKDLINYCYILLANMSKDKE